MKKVLYILGLLEDYDIDWLIDAGTREKYAPGEYLINEGVNSGRLMIVIEGSVAVHVGTVKVANIGVGEVIGEISLLDSRPPSASIISDGEGVIVLAVPFEKFHTKFASDPRFAARFYNALGVFLAQRLRKNNLQLTIGMGAELDEDDEQLDEIDEEVLEKITLAGARFNMLINKMKKA